MTQLTFDANVSTSQEVTLAPGYYQVTASAPGYYSQTRVAHIVEGLTTNMSFTLNTSQPSVTKHTLSQEVGPVGIYRTVTITRMERI